VQTFKKLLNQLALFTGLKIEKEKKRLFFDSGCRNEKELSYMLGVIVGT